MDINLTQNDFENLTNAFKIKKFETLNSILIAIKQSIVDDTFDEHLPKLFKLIAYFIKKSPITQAPIIKEKCEPSLIFKQLVDDNNVFKLFDLLQKVYTSKPRLKKCVERLFELRLDLSNTYFLKQLNTKYKKLKIQQSDAKNFVPYGLNYDKSLHIVSLFKDVVIFTQQDITREISDSCSLLIDGHSLIIECLFNSNLNLNCGGQTLHLIYLFERYIELFSNLSKHYFIVFFRDINTLLSLDKCMHLASSVIFNHMTQIEELKNKIIFFPSFYSIEYNKFLEKEKSTFIVMNDFNELKKLKLKEKLKQKIKVYI